MLSGKNICDVVEIDRMDELHNKERQRSRCHKGVSHEEASGEGIPGL